MAVVRSVTRPQVLHSSRFSYTSELLEPLDAAIASRKMFSTDPPLGALVEISTGRGIVRFCGATSFAQGKWVGIELYEPKGKNDGSIGGTAYFSCRPSYGVFIRPSQVKVISTEPEQPPINVSPDYLTQPRYLRITLSSGPGQLTNTNAPIVQDLPVLCPFVLVIPRLVPRVQSSLRPHMHHLEQQAHAFLALHHHRPP